MKSYNEMRAEYHSENADAIRAAWEKSLSEIEDAIRSGNHEAAQSTALITALYYPADLRSIGYDCEEARKGKCGRAYGVLEILYRRAFYVLSDIANKRGFDVAAIGAGKTALRETYSPALYGDGTLYGLDFPKQQAWTESITGKDWEKLPKQTRCDLRALRDVLEKINTIPQKKTTEILPGWERNKLKLVSVPNGKKPAVFKFGNETYTVPSGNAWETVCKLIHNDAFNSHGFKMKSPNQQFKRNHRPFFIERMSNNKSGWYIKTIE